VLFEDQDGMTSDWLPVMQKKTLQDKAYWMPDTGEHVVCLMDDNAEFGVIIGAIYSDADTPPVSSKDKYHVRFNDGTTLEYDRAAHLLKADVKGDINVLATGKADVTIDGKTTWISKGTIDHDGGSGSVKGIVQGACICAYTGKPHAHISSNVMASI
jgi:phage baseplate assembly protein V